MTDQKKNPAGGPGSNIHFLVQDSSKAKGFCFPGQAQSIKPPAQNSLLQWERVQAYRRIYEKECSLDSLSAFEAAMRKFTEVFPRG